MGRVAPVARRLAVSALCLLSIGANMLASGTATAATTGTGTITLVVTGGALSVASTGSAAFSVVLGSGTVTSAATNVNAATYTDATGSSSGWNATMALQQFVDTQSWVPTGTALLSNTSATYTGVAPKADYDVAVTSDGGTTVAVSWSGLESGTGTATKGSAFTIGTHGITITFKSGSTYLTSDRYTIRAGALPTTTLTLASGGSCVAQGTTASGANLPTMTNTSSTVTAGTYNTYGAAVKVVTAPVNAGLGTFICTPKATVAVDSNNAWASSYTALAQFSIITGP